MTHNRPKLDRRLQHAKKWHKVETLTVTRQGPNHYTVLRPGGQTRCSTYQQAFRLARALGFEGIRLG